MPPPPPSEGSEGGCALSMRRWQLAYDYCSFLDLNGCHSHHRRIHHPVHPPARYPPLSPACPLAVTAWGSDKKLSPAVDSCLQLTALCLVSIGIPQTTTADLLWSTHGYPVCEQLCFGNLSYHRLKKIGFQMCVCPSVFVAFS